VPTEAELLAAIYADPGDDAARAVYADWLQERGDPRGELIAMQLAGRVGPRERLLLERHERTWLGALEPIVSYSGLVFCRGFPAELVIGRRRHGWHQHVGPTGRELDGSWRDVIDHPAWATVEHVTVCAPNEAELLRELVCRRRLRALRAIHNVSATALLYAAHEGVTEITAYVSRGEVMPGTLRPRFPRLRRIVWNQLGTEGEAMADAASWKEEGVLSTVQRRRPTGD
jgi:uncharacterized protein (TIGR02996 family)